MSDHEAREKGYKILSPKETNNKWYLVKTWKDLNEMHPSCIETPATIAELQDVLKRAIQNKMKVKCIGAGHSFTCAPLVDDGGMLISLEKLNNIVELGDDYVTVQAGCSLTNIMVYLKKNGKQLPTCPVFGPFYAGAFGGTQLHESTGNVNRYATLSSYAISYKVLKADGSIELITSDLEYWRANQGLGGIVIEVTFRIIPLDKVLVEYDIVSWDVYWNNREALTKPYDEYFTIYIPLLDSFFVDKRKFVSEFPSYKFLNLRIKYGNFLRKNILVYFFTWFIYLIKFLPYKMAKVFVYVGVNYIFRFMYTKKVFLSLGPDRGIRVSKRPSEIYNDFMYDEDKYPVVMQAFRELLKTNKKLATCTQIGSYIVAQDTSCILSRTSKGRGYSIDPILLSRVDTGVHKVMDQVTKELALKYGGCPHFNKVVNLTPELIRNGYDNDKLKSYLGWCNKMDPNGVFQGKFYRLIASAVKIN